MRKHLLFFFVAITVLLTCSGCATALYIGGQCSGNAKYIRETNVKVFGNILNGDCELMKDIWDGPDDYILPPWPDRSLKTICLCLDFPISFVFDIITFPYQWRRYHHLPPLPDAEPDIPLRLGFAARRMFMTLHRETIKIHGAVGSVIDDAELT